MEDNIIFEDEELNIRFQMYKERLCIGNETLDKISKDIKMLEKVLESISLKKENTIFNTPVGNLFVENGWLMIQLNDGTIEHLIGTEAYIHIGVSKYLPDFLEHCLENIGNG